MISLRLHRKGWCWLNLISSVQNDSKVHFAIYLSRKKGELLYYQPRFSKVNPNQITNNLKRENIKKGNHYTQLSKGNNHGKWLVITLIETLTAYPSVFIYDTQFHLSVPYNNLKTFLNHLKFLWTICNEQQNWN